MKRMAALLLALVMCLSISALGEEELIGSWLEDYSFILDNEALGTIKVLANSKTFALPLLGVYTLIGSDVQYEGSDITISYENEKLTIEVYKKTVLNECGEQLLWLPPGGTYEIRLWIDDDMYVDEDSLFALLFDTTDWAFQIDKINHVVIFQKRSQS